jgi:hypothetical protein
VLIIKWVNENPRNFHMTRNATHRKCASFVAEARGRGVSPFRKKRHTSPDQAVSGRRRFKTPSIEVWSNVWGYEFQKFSLRWLMFQNFKMLLSKWLLKKLREDGWLKTSIYSIQNAYAWEGTNESETLVIWAVLGWLGTTTQYYQVLLLWIILAVRLA